MFNCPLGCSSKKSLQAGKLMHRHTANAAVLIFEMIVFICCSFGGIRG
ncbi:hypothetical protein EVA_15795 [gut metagenome]|uniref:Uncharacterized protein n=1 Tax=gut metagenome TaxID=749906 RepID=J9C8B8_9ZZZZ